VVKEAVGLTDAVGDWELPREGVAEDEEAREGDRLTVPLRD